MSIRSKLEARIAANTPDGGNATNRSKAVMMNLIHMLSPKLKPVDVSTLPVCEWADATEYIYLGNAHSIVVRGMVSPVRYGDRLNPVVAAAARDAGQRVIPINPNVVAVVADPIVEVPTVKESLPVQVVAKEKRKYVRKSALVQSAAV